MSSRYGGRGYGRFGGRDEAGERRFGRDYDDDEETTRYGREGYYGEGSRGSAGGYGLSGRDYGRGGERDYETFGGRDYGRPYDTGGAYGREYPSRYGRETTYYGGGGFEGRDYGRDFGRGYARDYERGREPDYDRDRDDRERGQDTDYGRTTSRFFGRGGDYERRYERDDKERSGRGSHERRGEGGGRGWVDRAADEVLSWFGDEGAERRRRLDDMRGGRNRGRGPKNYRRSDERIREEINDRLTEDDWLDATEIEVSVIAGEVVLTGEVESRRDKRYAEDIAVSVSGVNNVQNNLRVQNWRGREGERHAGSAAAATVPPSALGATATGGLPTTAPVDETMTETDGPSGSSPTGGTTSRAAKTSG